MRQKESFTYLKVHVNLKLMFQYLMFGLDIKSDMISVRPISQNEKCRLFCIISSVSTVIQRAQVSLLLSFKYIGQPKAFSLIYIQYIYGFAVFIQLYLYSKPIYINGIWMLFHRENVSPHITTTFCILQ